METRSQRHSLSQFGFSVRATTFHLIDLRHKGKHIESILLVKNRDFRLYNGLYITFHIDIIVWKSFLYLISNLILSVRIKTTIGTEHDI
jgi:hypothetical protein